MHAFAPPEFSTTAASRAEASAPRDHWTGAAWKRLDVNTAAATASGPEFTTSARSGRPEALIPATTPAAAKPFAAVTLMVRLRSG